jgi:hypothetical protein
MPARPDGGFLALNADFYLAIGHPRCRLAGDL